MPVRELAYDPHATYAARRILTIGGQQFPVGALIPRSLAPGGERQYKRWWDARMLMRAPEVANGHANVETHSAPGNGGHRVETAQASISSSAATVVNGHGAHEAQPVPKAMEPASERLMDMAAAQAVAAQGLASGERESGPAPSEPGSPLGEVGAGSLDAPDRNPNEGYIEPVGRGWCNVIFRDKTEKVRGLALASQRLDQFRVEAGLAPLIAQGETGEPTVPEGESEQPDSETPSAPWESGNG